MNLLDSPFLNHEEQISRKQKFVLKGNNIISTILILKSVIYIFYLELVVDYFGKSPFGGLPPPKYIPKEYITGNYNLKGVIEKTYDIVSLSIGFYFFELFTLLFFLFSVVLIFEQSKRKTVAILLGLLAMIITLYVLSGDLVDWVLGD